MKAIMAAAMLLAPDHCGEDVTRILGAAHALRDELAALPPFSFTDDQSNAWAALQTMLSALDTLEHPKQQARKALESAETALRLANRAGGSAAAQAALGILGLPVAIADGDLSEEIEELTPTDHRGDVPRP
jgi:hypothetical protein